MNGHARSTLGIRFNVLMNVHAFSTLGDYELLVYISPQILIKLPRQVDFWRLQTSPRGLERGRGASQEVGPGNGGEDMKSHSAIMIFPR